MDIYTLSRMTQIEHQQKMRSLRPVPKYGDQVAERKRERWHLPLRLARVIFTAILHLMTK